jgi:hypothetical protein
MRYIRLLLCVCLFYAIPAASANECTAEKGCQPQQFGLTAAQIAALPQVTLPQLEPNTTLMYDRRYRNIPNGASVYDAPDGNIIRVIDPGQVYVTTYKDDNGWTRINRAEWVRTSDVVKATPVSSFTGVFLPDVIPPYGFAWALMDVYPSAVPGGEPVITEDKSTLVQRYDVLHIYATTEIDATRWYQVGADQWVHGDRVARIEPLTDIPATVDTSLWFGIDLLEQTITVYEDDKPIFATLVSTGLPLVPTNEGTFHIYQRYERKKMTSGAWSSAYYMLEEVPSTMFFNGTQALHGVYWHDAFGYPQSHGCVNMSMSDARWMWDQVAHYLGVDAPSDASGPAVYIYGGNELE